MQSTVEEWKCHDDPSVTRLVVDELVVEKQMSYYSATKSILLHY